MKVGGEYGGWGSSPYVSQPGDGGRDPEGSSNISSSIEGTDAGSGKCGSDPRGALAKAALRDRIALSSVATCPEIEVEVR